ncbi:MAG: hypothetical protein ACOYLQ_09400 [Hyphomicrobiaceae bacterium]
MTKLVRIANQAIVEIAPLGAVFHVDAGFLEAPDSVQVGWVYSNGNFSPPTASADPVPQQVTLWQARSACRIAGVFDQINTYVEAHADALPILYEAWNYGNTVSRNGQFVTTIGPSLGLTDAELDQLFRQASQLKA